MDFTDSHLCLPNFRTKTNQMCEGSFELKKSMDYLCKMFTKALFLLKR